MDDLGPAPGIRPRPSLWRRLDAIARASFPLTCTVLLMLLAIAIISVYFWSLFRPPAIPPLAVFLLGLLLDLLGWLPLGTGPFCLLAVLAFCQRWRRGLANQGFLLVWLVFAGFATAAAVVLWGFASLLTLRLMPAGPAAFQALLTAA